MQRYDTLPALTRKRFRRKRLLIFAGAVLFALSTAIISGMLYFSAPHYRGPRSDHFDGRRFQNLEPFRDKTLADVIRWSLSRTWQPWSVRSIEGARNLPARVGSGEIVVTHVNHSTVLVQTDGLNLLTDPVWSERVSPFSFLGPKRHHPPGIAFDDLPPIDIVLISHNHYDHLDLATLKRLAKRDHPLFVTSLGNSLLLRHHGIERAVDLDWWGEIDHGISISVVPAQHWSGRSRPDRRTSLWSGFVIRTASGSIYFAGDTGVGKHFAMTRERYGPFRLALLPIGAYLPRDFMKENHISPEEAIDASEALEASFTIPIHYGCFQLGDDGQDQPLAELGARLEARRPRSQFRVLRPGESWSLPQRVEM